jgi:hypothetical protein
MEDAHSSQFSDPPFDSTIGLRSYKKKAFVTWTFRKPPPAARPRTLRSVQAKLRSLTPTTDAQRQLLSQAEQISGDMLQARWLLIEQAQSALPLPFLVVLLFCLTMLFLSFGLFAPRNATVIIVLLIGAMSVSGAIFIILEMNHPLQGMIKVSSAPMRKALEHLGQ